LSIALKNYQGINFKKEVKDCYNEKYKSMRKEIEEDIRGCKDFPCSWIRINIMKMAILPNLYNQFICSMQFPSKFE
jgi:hypothetical protein